MPLHIGPLREMGARVTGLDLDRPIAAVDQAALRDAWQRYGILVFPASGVGSAEKQLRLSHVFGEDEPHSLPELIVPEQPNLILITYDGDYQGDVVFVDGEPRNGWLFWHQDEAYTTNIPIGSLLRMVTATDKGGETGFIDVARAYAELPEALKARLEGLTTLHQLCAGVPRPDAFGMRGIDVRRATQDEFRSGDKAVPTADAQRFHVIESPLVVTHPYSGRKTMLLSPFGLIGMGRLGKAEGDEILHEVCDRVIQDKYRYLHSWRADDMILWDNWTTMHMAMGYAPGATRVAYRTTIKGPSDSRTGTIYQGELPCQAAPAPMPVS